LAPCTSLLPCYAQDMNKQHSDEFIEEMRQVCCKAYKQEITTAEARDIVRRLDILHELAKEFAQDSKVEWDAIMKQEDPRNFLDHLSASES